jgi:hypothetical protein
LDRSAFTVVADSLLDAGFKLRFRAGGHSMGSAVRDGEHVTVAPVDARDIDVGDIVLCQTWRGPLAHRVQWIERAAAGAARFVLRGDASFEDDRPVAAGQLRGRVVSVERDGRAIDLAVRGGALGRRLFVAALRARAALAAGTRDALASFAASVVNVPRSADGLESSGR